jgi:hypothetical protein
MAHSEANLKSQSMRLLTLSKLSNAMCLAVDIAQRIANIASTDDVLVSVDIFIGKWENHTDSQGGKMSIHLKNKILSFPKASQQTHEDFIGVLRQIIWETKKCQSAV